MNKKLIALILCVSTQTLFSQLSREQQLSLESQFIEATKAFTLSQWDEAESPYLGIYNKDRNNHDDHKSN